MPENMDVKGQSSDPRPTSGLYSNKPYASQYISPYTPQNSNQRMDLELNAAISLLQPIYEFVGTSSTAGARHVPPASVHSRSNVGQSPPTTTDPAAPSVDYPNSAVMCPNPNENRPHSNSVPPGAEYAGQITNSYTGSYHPQLPQPVVAQHGNPQQLKQSTLSASSVTRPLDIAGSASPQARRNGARSPASNTTPKKTRAKTGCLTCRKRKTKVCHLSFKLRCLLMVILTFYSATKRNQRVRGVLRGGSSVPGPIHLLPQRSVALSLSHWNNVSHSTSTDHQYCRALRHYELHTRHFDS